MCATLGYESDNAVWDVSQEVSGGGIAVESNKGWRVRGPHRLMTLW